MGRNTKGNILPFVVGSASGVLSVQRVKLQRSRRSDEYGDLRNDFSMQALAIFYLNSGCIRGFFVVPVIAVGW